MADYEANADSLTQFQFPPPPHSLTNLNVDDIQIVPPPPPLDDVFISESLDSIPPPLPKTAPPKLPKKPPPPVPKKTSTLSSRPNSVNVAEEFGKSAEVK